MLGLMTYIYLQGTVSYFAIQYLDRRLDTF